MMTNFIIYFIFIELSMAKKYIINVEINNNNMDIFFLTEILKFKCKSKVPLDN